MPAWSPGRVRNVWHVASRMAWSSRSAPAGRSMPRPRPPWAPASRAQKLKATRSMLRQPLGRHQLEGLDATSLAQHPHADALADLAAVQDPCDVIDAGDGIAIEGQDDVARLQTRDLSRTSRLHLDHAHARLLAEACLRAQALRQVDLIAGHPEASTAHATMLQDLRDNMLGGVGGHRKTDASRAHDHGGVDADHLGPRIDKR